MVVEISISYSLSVLVEQVRRLLEKSIRKRKETPIIVVAMFDLPNSTQLKVSLGHSKGTRIALEHNLICETIVKKFGGSVIKHMGNGLFIEFDAEDIVNACLAAIEIKKLTAQDSRFSTKGGLTLGMVERIKIGEIPDIMGTTVDRCARLASMALPNQILTDVALYQVAISFLHDNPNIFISNPILKKAKGLGTLQIYELSTKELGLIGFESPFFQLIEEGRLSLPDKMSFVEKVKGEVIEIGVGLTSFSDYFTRRSSSEFKDKIINLLKRRVKIKCLLLDPEGEMAKQYIKDNNEPQYLDRMRYSLLELREIKKEFLSLGLEGFHIMTYDKIPQFHATCLDLNMPSGKMLISHYLRGVLRSRTPVLRFSKNSKPKLFNVYKSSIDKLIHTAKEVQ